MTWTSEQEEAIYSRNKNLLVTAAAGAGKTAVLVERIIQMIIKDQIDIDRLLIVTFTNAAAAEMRERISAGLLAEIEKDNGSNRHLRKQINLLPCSAISTLHSFCSDIVRKHFHLVNIDPSFRIADSTESELIKNELLEDLFESEYEISSEIFLGLVEMFGANINDYPLQELVLRLYNFIQSQPYPIDWLRKRSNDFSVEEESFEKSVWVSMLKQDISIELQTSAGIFCEARRICELAGGPLEYRQAIIDDLHIIELLQQALESGLTSFYSLVNNLKHSRLARIPKKAAVEETLKEQVKSLREDGKKILAGLRSVMSRSPGDYCHELNKLQPFMSYLAELVEKFSLSYRERKAEKAILDFNDLEHLALEILSYEAVADEYRLQYKFIFVDEYQDSNLVQDSIINLIKRDDNLFMVGDVKQSIYRFRLADPSLFMEKQDSYNREDSGQNCRIDLNMNFRSRSPIIAAVNYLFGHLMTREFGEIDYGEDAYLRPGLALDHYLKTGDKKAAMDGENLSLLSPLPELYVIENNLIIEEQREAHEKEDDEEAAGQEGEGQEPGDESESLMDMEAEACLLVSLIKEITARQYYDRENELIRQVDYRDIVVLLRSTRNSAAVILEHLISEGIPAYADVNNGYFETIEIEIFMNLLKIIDNKRQDIPLLSVMRSPIGGFSIEEFVQIRLAYPRDNGQVPAFYQALIQYSEDYNDELSSKLQFFLEKIKKWKAEARYMRMDEYIWKLFMDSGYYYYVGAMPGGEQRQANLRILIDRARQFQRTSIRGLFNFIKFVERIRSGSGDLGSARILGENDNVVRIMSIHKSKGLEFPVMIIAGLGKRFNNTDVTGPVLFHRELGLGPRYVDPVLRIRRDTLPRMIIKKRVKLENLAEEMRILYVACTRPQDKLFLVGTVRKLESCLKKWKKEPAPHNLSLGQNYLDWIMPVLMHHRDGSRLRELAGIPGKNNIIPDESRWRIEIIKGVQGKLGTQTESSEIEDYKNRLLGNDLQAESEKRELVWSRLDWQYPYKQSATIPSKLSVTAIKNLQTGMLAGDGNLPEGDLKMTLRERKLEGKREISAAQKGTLMHFVMRHLELSRVHSREEIEAQINEMIAGELLREEEAFIIDIAKIEGFFRTPLGKRILAAAHVYREVPFNLLISARELMKDTDSDEQLLVQGVIDLYFREGNEMVLVDYKSDWVTPETQESVIDKYRVQLEWYKKALERIQGKKVKESFLYLFALGREIRID